MGTTLQHRILPDEQGERLDRILARAWPELTRSRIQSLLKQGHVTVDARPARASDSARAGALAEANIPAAIPSVLVPESIPCRSSSRTSTCSSSTSPQGSSSIPARASGAARSSTRCWRTRRRSRAWAGSRAPGSCTGSTRTRPGSSSWRRADAAFQGLTKDLARRAIARRYLALAWGVPGDLGAEGRIAGRARARPEGSQAHRRAARGQRRRARGGNALARAGNSSPKCGETAHEPALRFLGDRADTPDPRALEPCRISGRRRRNLRWKRQKDLEPPSGRP
jgi:hypothetical protein